jgi:hypothetical protein
MGVTLAKGGNLDSAKEMIRRALAAAPGHPVYTKNLERLEIAIAHRDGLPLKPSAPAPKRTWIARALRYFSA